MCPCDRSDAFNYADSKLLLRGSEEGFFFFFLVLHSNTSRSKEWESSMSRLLLHSLVPRSASCWEGEKERNLLKALQTRRPFNKMHLIFLLFALVK